MPDLNTFGLLCRWLQLDPAELLGVERLAEDSAPNDVASAHLKANREIDPATAAALAKAIVLAQRMLHDAPTRVDETDGERL